MRYSPFVAQIVPTSFDRNELTTFVMWRKMEISSSEHNEFTPKQRENSGFYLL